MVATSTVAHRIERVADAIRKGGGERRDTGRPYLALGGFVRRIRESRRLKQGDVARGANMRQPQLTHLEKGGNVAIEYYDRVAKAMGFRGALDMFMSGGDEQLRKLLRYWRALPDDEARTDALQLLRDLIVGDEGSAAKAVEGRAVEKTPARGRTGK